uniref:Secreted protein n=1 Tax=Achlya hypogyna TaxID=1202772 RepID=A0A0A7CNL5_ACHHY|nr:secreted protein [Achlya hypogyna]
MKTAILLAAAAASAIAADCQMTDFLPLAGYLNDKSVFGLCAKDIGISFMDFTNPSWIPTDLAMTKKFAASASCKEFFALVTAQMLKITPPCTLKQGPTTTTSDVAGYHHLDRLLFTDDNDFLSHDGQAHIGSWTGPDDSSLRADYCRWWYHCETFGHKVNPR